MTYGGSGGGAGGSIWLVLRNAGTFAGSGTVSANGGAAANYNNFGTTACSGGGSGGRISVFAPTSLGWTVNASGGTAPSGCSTAGSNGVVYTEVTTAPTKLDPHGTGR